MILPDGSIRRLKGIPLNLKVSTALLLQNLRSLICVQSSLSAWIASCQGPFSLSRETPSTVKFRPFTLSYSFNTLGFSARHRPHQLAQKSTSRNLPLKEARETERPLTSGKEKSG